MKNTESKKLYTTTLVEDENGDIMLPFSPEFCEQNDWQPNDIVKFTVNEDQSCIITNLSWEERQGFGYESINKLL